MNKINSKNADKAVKKVHLKANYDHITNKIYYYPCVWLHTKDGKENQFNQRESRIKYIPFRIVGGNYYKECV